MFHSPKFVSSDQSGVTLVELLVVIIIIVIVAALAMMQKGSANAVFQRQNVATQLKNAFERARFDSVKRRAQSSPDVRATVRVDSNSYTLTTYNVDSSGTATANPLATTTAGDVVIAGSGLLSLPFTVYYNQRGEAVDSSGNSISPAFYVCNASCSSPTDSNANLLIVTPTGTVNLLAGGSAVPAFNAPPVTNIPQSAGINNTVRLP
jgi:prepilin-type N-terminal cleavage/methylation domain-containing protein